MDRDLLSCLHSLLLLLLHDVGAHECNYVIHRTVGEHVEIPICTPWEGLSYVEWRFKSHSILDWDSEDGEPSEATRAPGVRMSSTNFSLLIGRVTVENSGIYQFLSLVKEQQNPRTIITLHVDEVTVRPVIVLSSTWHNWNSSCTVLLECRGLHQANVSFSWTIRSQNYKGTNVSLPLRLQEHINATCMASSTSRDVSVSTPVTCVNTSVDLQWGPLLLYVVVGVAGAVLVFLVPVLICALRYRKGKYRGADTDEMDATIYAGITDNAQPGEVAPNDPHPIHSSTTYETIEDQRQIYTVYDEIHLNC